MTTTHKIPVERIQESAKRNRPKALDIGTISCYFTFDELEMMENAVESRAGGGPFEELLFRIREYKKTYQRRMKDAT
jgi:hypothetical protein